MLLVVSNSAGVGEQITDDCGERVQSRQPLLVSDQMRESRGVITSQQEVSLLQRGDAKAALHQRDGDDLGIREGGRFVGRTPPLCQPRVGFQVVINEAVDFRHLVLYAAHGSLSSGGGRCGVATSFYPSAQR
jgi:hypothetical protein